jgi:hypothetical protein
VADSCLSLIKSALPLRALLKVFPMDLRYDEPMRRARCDRLTSIVFVWDLALEMFAPRLCHPEFACFAGAIFHESLEFKRVTTATLYHAH